MATYELTELPSRAYRRTPAKVLDAQRKQANIRFKHGALSKHAFVSDHGQLIFDAKTYPDDILAVVRNLSFETYEALKTVGTGHQQLLSKKHYVNAVTQHALILIMDVAAVVAHGYGYSEEEANFDLASPLTQAQRAQAAAEYAHTEQKAYLESLINLIEVTEQAMEEVE